jgi:uncharacterized membrane protein YqjE
MKSLSGLLGALSLLTLLAMVGAASFPQASVRWTALALPAVLFAILSVTTYRIAMSKDASAPSQTTDNLDEN